MGCCEIRFRNEFLARAFLGALLVSATRRGTVCFGSALYGWSFTLESFARLYAERRGVEMDTKKFAKRLWGDSYFHADARAFRAKPPPGGGDRSFVQFVLEPLYKVYAQAVGEHAASFAAVLAEFKVRSSPRSTR